MAIDQIGVPASVPQQFEQLITSSTNWSVPAGVRSVEVLMAGGGGSNQARGGVSKFLYNVQGRTSIPVVVGARAPSNGQTGGTTIFDTNCVATGGFYNSDTNFRIGNFVNLATAAPESLTNNTPLAGRTNYSDGTTATFRHFAGFNGFGISISSDGALAATTVDGGVTWLKATATGHATNFANFVSTRDLNLHHNGGLWVMFVRQSGVYGYSTNGTNWVIVNFGAGINDMIATGPSTSRQAIIVTDSNYWYTSNIATTAFSSVVSDRGDVLFRVGGDSGVIAFRGGSSQYRWSNNGGASWSTSSYTGMTFQSVNRWNKNYSTNTGDGIIFQRGQFSSEFSAVARTGSNDQYAWQSWSSINTGGSGSTSSPSGSTGPNTTNTTVHLYRPQSFNENDIGAFAAWSVGGAMTNRNDTANYSYINTNDGSMTGSNFAVAHLGGNFIYDVSEYVLGLLPGSVRVAFTDMNRADGFIYRAAGYTGHGVASGNIQSGLTQLAPSASGNFWTSSWSTTNPTNTSYYDGGEEGWGRNHGQLPGLGFGGVSQNGAVRLRWWA